MNCQYQPAVNSLTCKVDPGVCTQVPRCHRKLTFAFECLEKSHFFGHPGWASRMGIQDFMFKNVWTPHNFSQTVELYKMYVDNVSNLPVYCTSQLKLSSQGKLFSTSLKQSTQCITLTFVQRLVSISDWLLLQNQCTLHTQTTMIK